MLAEDFHDAAIDGDVVVIGRDLAGEDAIGEVEERIQAVGVGLIGADDAEVFVRVGSAFSICVPEWCRE